MALNAVLLLIYLLTKGIAESINVIDRKVVDDGYDTSSLPFIRTGRLLITTSSKVK